MSKTDAANAIAEMMTVWNTIEARVKAAHPNAEAEAVYRITADAMTNAVAQAVQEGGEMSRYHKELSRATSTDVTSSGHAEFTSRCLPSHLEGMAEMREDGAIDGVPVSIYHMLTEADCAQEDMSNVDWESTCDRIELDLCECDRKDISDEAIAAVVARLG